MYVISATRTRFAHDRTRSVFQHVFALLFSHCRPEVFDSATHYLQKALCLSSTNGVKHVPQCAYYARIHTVCSIREHQSYITVVYSAKVEKIGRKKFRSQVRSEVKKMCSVRKNFEVKLTGVEVKLGKCVARKKCEKDEN